ncbi:MAG: PilW family protein [Patescibacteria group bacterium]
MKQNFKKAFTVIEVLVAVTILSIIMISVMQIYISSSDISLKTDINRSMQENIKNAIETIAEDIRKKPLN